MRKSSSQRLYFESFLLLWASGCITGSSALMFPLPAIATDAALLTPVNDAKSPAITSSPKIVRRQAQNLLGYLGPDNICGYVQIDPQMATPKTCEAGETCAVASAQAGCCTGGIASCVFQTTCINGEDLGKSCNSNCSKDPATVKCWGATFWQCGPTSRVQALGQPVQIQTTSEGATPGTRTWSTVTAAAVQVNPTSSSPLPFPKAFGGTSGGGGGESSSGNGGGSGTNSGSGTNKSSTPIGAVVGGVVGGLAIIGASAFGVTWLILRESRRRRSEGNTVATEKPVPMNKPSPTSNPRPMDKPAAAPEVHHFELPAPHFQGGNSPHGRHFSNGGLPAELDHQGQNFGLSERPPGRTTSTANGGTAWELGNQTRPVVASPSARPNVNGGMRQELENQAFTGATGNHRPGHQMEHNANHWQGRPEHEELR